MSGRLDCVVVGYNDRDFRGRLAALKLAERATGGYQSLRLQSLPMEGRRVTYMELLNAALQRATGRDPALHIGEMPSLGSWYLWNFLTKNGYAARVVNLFSSQREEFVRLLEEERPRAVAITTTFYVDDAPIREVAELARRCSPDTKVIVGGPHVFNVFAAHEGRRTLAPILEAMGADVYIHDSQGELTLCRVLSHLRGECTASELPVEPKSARHASNALGLSPPRPAVSTASLHTIPNLAFFEGSQVVSTERVPESNDLDVYSIDWDAVDPRHFVPTVTTRTARSCAFSCAFCRYPIIAGPLNLKSTEAVIRQFDQFERHGVKQVVIIDDTFNVPLPRFKELCRAVAARKYGFRWYSYFRPSNSDEEAFDLAAESGCGGVFIGIESGDQGILNAMNKSARVDKYVTGVQELNKRGVITFASMIVGFPGETAASVDNSIAFIEEAAPTYWRAGLYFHSNTAPIHDQAAALGIRGTAYSWTHATMSWREAVAERRRMVETVSGSSYLPGYNFDFWAIPYLIGKGVDKHRHRAFCDLAHGLLLRELAGEDVDAGAELDRFAALFSSVPSRTSAPAAAV